jgi:hypothetical protein
MLSLQVAWYPAGRAPETEAVRLARFERIALSVERASWRASGDEWPYPAEELAALLVMEGWYESKFVWRVHAGKCRLKLGECDVAIDSRGRLFAKAAGTWQVQASQLVPFREWRTLTGTDQASTDRAAWAAAKILSASRKRCGRGNYWPEATISLYATGRSCRWRGAPQRARTFRRLLRNHFKSP